MSELDRLELETHYKPTDDSYKLVATEAITVRPNSQSDGMAVVELGNKSHGAALLAAWKDAEAKTPFLIEEGSAIKFRARNAELIGKDEFKRDLYSVYVDFWALEKRR